jgi:glycosyltransferase involved in cell wall biosynthesis
MDATMRVLFVTSMHPSPADPRRGVIVARLAEALRALGHVIDFFPLGHAGGALRYVRARPRVAALVRRSAPDVVHAHFGYSGLAVPALPVPVITSFYGDDLNGTWARGGRTTWTSKIGVLISQLTARRSARCIVASRALRDKLWSDATRQRTVVVRDAVDPGLFRPYPRDAARERLGIPPTDTLILFPHDVTQPNKRLGLADAAVAQLRRSDARAQLWVVNGKAPDDMPWYYAAADAMVITSVLEGGPSSAKEALACGLPVVAVPVGDLQLFEDAPDAMLRADPTPQALAETLVRALSVSRQPRRSRLPQELTLSAAAQRVEEVYRAAVRSRAAESSQR